MSQTVYLDYAAATPLDSQVLDSMMPYFKDNYFNPSADYLNARNVAKELSSARATVAYWLGAQNSEIIFTAGGTEANNLAIHGTMLNYPKANILISAIEHDSVRKPAAKYHNREIPVHPDGRIVLEKVSSLIDDSTVLVSVMYANNEIGTIQPLRKLRQIIDAVVRDRKDRGNNTPLYLHTDACQAGNYLDLHVSRLGVDLLSLNGGKIYGPKQSGALYVNRNVKLSPIIDGGGQELNLRSGTENVAADIGLSTALDLAQSHKKTESIKLTSLRDYFIALLENEIEGVIINGSLHFRLANNVHISIPNKDNEYMLISLDQRGIMAAAGSACSAAKGEPSLTLKALGLEPDLARSSLRFSLGRDTKKADIDYTVSALKNLI